MCRVGLLLTIAPFSVAACAPTLPVVLPSHVVAQHRGDLTEAKVAALAPSASSVAFVANQGLYLVTQGKKPRHLTRVSPSLLRWSRGGTRLATAQVLGSRTRLETYDREGRPLASTIIKGRATALAWRGDDELLVLAAEFRGFSFGGQLRGILYRWRAGAAPRETTLWDKTVRVRRKASPKALLQAMHLAMAPWGDEVLYSRPQQPPAVPASTSIIVRHLDTQREREVARFDGLQTTFAHAADGEHVLYADRRRTWIADPWSGKQRDYFSVGGNSLLGSRDHAFAWIAGHIVTGNGREIVHLEGCRPLSLGKGSLLASCGGRVWQLSGLPRRQALPWHSPHAQRLRTLRRWRALGLIEAAQYEKSRKELLAR